MSNVVMHDAVDDLVTALNTIKGLAFERDAWEDKAPDNYGVVELVGQAGSLYADDTLQDAVYQARVTVYVDTTSDTVLPIVQEKIQSCGHPCSMPSREFLFDIAKVKWEWNVWITAPLDWTEAE